MNEKKLIAFLKKDRLYIRAVLILAVTGFSFSCLYFYDNGRELPVNENGQKILERTEDGTESSYDLEVQIDGVECEIEVPVSARMRSKEEVKEMFQEQKRRLEELILGENESLDEVRSRLDLIGEIPDTGIAVSWTTDNYEVLDSLGNISSEDIPKEGVAVKLTALMKYKEEESAYEFYVRVFPSEMKEEEEWLQKIAEKAKESDENTVTDQYMVLPEYVEGKKLVWNYERNTRAFAILVLGAGMCSMMLISGSQRKKETDKKAVRQMKIDYPQIINKFNLYIRAGLTVRRAWFLIVQDYERNAENMRKAYEEMAVSMHQMQGGTAETDAYEEFGIRCGIASYRRLGSMLAQNVRKGSRGLTVLLEREAEEAIEERKNLAKKLGEEAGTKLMIPMFLMLAVVFAIVIVPAFFSIQI